MIQLLLNIFIIIIAGRNQLNPELKNYLDKNLSGYTNYNYEVVSLPKGIKNPNDCRLRINEAIEFKVNNGFGYIPVEIKYSNGYSLKSFITIKLRLFNNVFVSARKISKGESLYPEDFRVEEKEVTNLKDNLFLEMDKINLYKANLVIEDESILQQYMLKQIPLINRGNTLTAYNIVGSVSVSFKATAYEEGNFGEVIRIVNAKNQYFNALILDSENVKIVE